MWHTTLHPWAECKAILFLGGRLAGANTANVLLAIRCFQGDNDYAYPSVGMIAEQTGLNRATVFRALERLETINYVEVDRKGGAVNHYKLTEHFMHAVENSKDVQQKRRRKRVSAAIKRERRNQRERAKREAMPPDPKKRRRKRRKPQIAEQEVGTATVDIAFNGRTDTGSPGAPFDDTDKRKFMATGLLKLSTAFRMNGPTLQTQRRALLAMLDRLYQSSEPDVLLTRAVALAREKKAETRLANPYAAWQRAMDLVLNNGHDGGNTNGPRPGPADQRDQ